MKAKNVLIVFAVILIAMSFFACDIFTTSKIGKDTKPYPKNITVKYVRVQPIPSPSSPNLISLTWLFGSYQGGDGPMTLISDNEFQRGGVLIKTETVITICVTDPQEFNGSPCEVCKYIYIDGQELVVSYTYGQVKFIYHNDGKVEVYTGGTQ